MFYKNILIKFPISHRAIRSLSFFVSTKNLLEVFQWKNKETEIMKVTDFPVYALSPLFHSLYSCIIPFIPLPSSLSLFIPPSVSPFSHLSISHFIPPPVPPFVPPAILPFIPCSIPI
jgi:hypothetical protein